MRTRDTLHAEFKRQLATAKAAEGRDQVAQLVALSAAETLAWTIASRPRSEADRLRLAVTRTALREQGASLRTHVEVAHRLIAAGLHVRAHPQCASTLFEWLVKDAVAS